MKKFLPSRKIVAILIIPILAIFVINIFIFSDDKDSGVEIAENINFSEAFSKLPSRVKDTDNDGLFDWEETLYGTDPVNQDSDGDGKLDGDEVDSGTDPNINGNEQDDTVTDSVAGVDNLDYRKDPELSKTDILAKDFLSIYKNLKDGGNLGTPVEASAVQAVIDRNIDNFFKPTHKSSDINVTGTTEQSLRTYYGKYISLFDNVSENKEYELFLFARYLETENEEHLVILEQNLDSLKVVTASLLDMDVPETALFEHLNVLNSYEVVVSIVEEMLSAKGDPVYQFSLANSFALAESELRESVYRLALFFQKNNLQ